MLKARDYDRRMDPATGEAATALAQLTTREREILRRTALGETNAEIAARLDVTVHAVKFHLASVFRKLGVHNRTKAAAVYLAATGS
jgi:DNA-binding CsgD family transcriptional regulator